MTLLVFNQVSNVSDVEITRFSLHFLGHASREPAPIRWGRHPGCEEIRKIVLIIRFSDVHKELLTFKKSFILVIYCIFCFGLRISVWPKSWALKTSMDSLSI